MANRIGCNCSTYCVVPHKPPYPHKEKKTLPFNIEGQGRRSAEQQHPKWFAAGAELLEESASSCQQPKADSDGKKQSPTNTAGCCV
ncbi:MAG: hypothetical protein ACQCN6_04255 [Candidatus Bathyarchaeia archaeon]